MRDVIISKTLSLTLSWLRSLSYRNQSIDLLTLSISYKLERLRKMVLLVARAISPPYSLDTVLTNLEIHNWNYIYYLIFDFWTCLHELFPSFGVKSYGNCSSRKPKAVGRIQPKAAIYQKQPSPGNLIKRCYENLQQIYRTPMPKIDSNKVAKQVEITPRHTCSINFLHVPRTLFYKNIFERLPLIRRRCF